LITDEKSITELPSIYKNTSKLLTPEHNAWEATLQLMEALKAKISEACKLHGISQIYFRPPPIDVLFRQIALIVAGSINCVVVRDIRLRSLLFPDRKAAFGGRL